MCTALLFKAAVELTRLVEFPASDVFMLFVEFIVEKCDAAKVENSNADCKNCVRIRNLKRPGEHFRIRCFSPFQSRENQDRREDVIVFRPMVFLAIIKIPRGRCDDLV